VEGKETGWKTGKFRYMQISELYSTDECEQAAVDILAATGIGKFPST
jgi:hypothetical protein